LNAQSRGTSPAVEQEEKVRQGVQEGDEFSGFSLITRLLAREEQHLAKHLASTW